MIDCAFHQLGEFLCTECVERENEAEAVEAARFREEEEAEESYDG